MCLDRVVAHYDEPLQDVLAYKLFEGEGPRIPRRGDRVRLLFKKLRGRAFVKTGLWLTASQKIIGNAVTYTSGFHAYASLRAAKREKWSKVTIYKVLLRGVHTVGQQKGKIYVARQMKILGQVK